MGLHAIKCYNNEECWSCIAGIGLLFVPHLNTLHLSILRCVISLCENRIVVLLRCLLSTSPLVCGANTIWFVEAEHLLEALLKVVREEGIEDWVSAGVDVGEDDYAEVDGGAVLRDDVNQVDNVGSEERQPAKYKHQHDDHHHARHLPLRPSPPSQACTHTC